MSAQNERNSNYKGQPIYDWSEVEQDYIQVGTYELIKFNNRDELISTYSDEKAKTATENFLDHNPEATETEITNEMNKNKKYFMETVCVSMVSKNHAKFHNVTELATQFLIKDFGYALIEE